MVKITKCYSPKILFFLMLIVGLFMLFLSLRMPKYSETKEYEVLNEKYYNGEISEEKYCEELYDNINPIMDIYCYQVVENLLKRVTMLLELLKKLKLIESLLLQMDFGLKTMMPQKK